MEDINEVNKRLCKWCEDNMEIKLPRWEDLPELDLYMDQVSAFTEKHLRFFAEDGTNTRRHIGNQQFFARGGENVKGEIIGRCIEKLTTI